jgi:hypothetical protein
MKITRIMLAKSPLRLQSPPTRTLRHEERFLTAGTMGGNFG